MDCYGCGGPDKYPVRPPAIGSRLNGSQLQVRTQVRRVWPAVALSFVSHWHWLANGEGELVSKREVSTPVSTRTAALR